MAHRTKSGLSAFFQSRPMMLFMKYAPTTLSGAVVHGLGWLYHALHDVERRTIRRNIVNFARPLGLLTPYDLFSRARSGLYEHYFEKMLVASKSRSYLSRYVRKRAVFEREAVLAEALNRGKGVVMVTAHWGAVELLPVLLKLRGYPVSVILETSTPLLASTLQRLAAGSDVELIIESAGTAVLKAALDALGRGRILITQCDEVDAWRRRKSRTIRLFDRDLYFDHVIDFIADKTDAAVVGVYCRRLASRRYRFIAEPIALNGKGSGAATKSLRLWERYVRETPEQWYQWKKWRAMVPESAVATSAS
ncbi:MAG: lysophospholipid acyltransferase family protein [Spirochaetales bacterium]|nr:lysophospholipid acyltransferase family protein [Spirochaetales bacterium]